MCLVIGAHGAVIKYIQDISGAKVNFIKGVIFFLANKAVSHVERV